MFCACETPPPAPIPPARKPIDFAYSNWNAPNETGVAGKIRAFVEAGSPSSLRAALDMIESEKIAATDWGREFRYVAVALLRAVYGGSLLGTEKNLPPVDPLLTHPYTKIIERFRAFMKTAPVSSAIMATVPPLASDENDYLALILPFAARLDSSDLANYSSFNAESRENLAAYQAKAAQLNPKGALAPFFSALLDEWNGDTASARAHYRAALAAQSDCYPASVALARLAAFDGAYEEAVALLQDVLARFPDETSAERLLGLLYFRLGAYKIAEAYIDKVTAKNKSRAGAPPAVDAPLYLAKAAILFDNHSIAAAKEPLDIYALYFPDNAEYILLRGRYYAEALHDNTRAEAAFRHVIAVTKEAATKDGATPEERATFTRARYNLAKLLLENDDGNEGDGENSAKQNEGRALLAALIAETSADDSVFPAALDILTLGVADAMNRKDWTEAATLENRILTRDPSPTNLTTAWTIASARGNTALALSFARRLYEADSANIENRLILIEALGKAGETAEARGNIDAFLAGAKNNATKSRLYFARSLLASDDAAALDDLRTSLFLNPRNLDTLAALFRHYHAERDSFRALHYLKQIAALDPKNPLVAQYGKTYGVS